MTLALVAGAGTIENSTIARRTPYSEKLECNEIRRLKKELATLRKIYGRRYVNQIGSLDHEINRNASNR